MDIQQVAETVLKNREDAARKRNIDRIVVALREPLETIRRAQEKGEHSVTIPFPNQSFYRLQMDLIEEGLRTMNFTCTSDRPSREEAEPEALSLRVTW